MGDKPPIHDSPVEDDRLADYGHLGGWRSNPFRIARADTVLLDPDVREVFRTSEDVNVALQNPDRRETRAFGLDS